MIARRALEPNHLWEDLGLRNRGELTRLMARHFATLAVRNDKNMRRKRFIYRLMCENDGFVMCATPVCRIALTTTAASAPKRGPAVSTVVALLRVGRLKRRQACKLSDKSQNKKSKASRARF